MFSINASNLYHLLLLLFPSQVNKYLEMEPFNYPNPLGYFGGGKEVIADGFVQS